MTSGNTVSYSIKEFLNTEEIVGVLTEKNQQTRAWDEEITILKEALKDYEDHDGKIIFEYGIPGFSKVVDVIILVGNYILILEYKTGQQTFSNSDIDQVLGYAYRIKYFHSHSKDKKIIPVLVATEAKESCLDMEETEDGVFKIIKTNAKGNKDLIKSIMHKAKTKNSDWHNEWESGIFKESPDIIQYITRIWNDNEVDGLDNNNLERKNIIEALQVENKIRNIIEETKNNKRKALIFITGVPGAGKTLVGLNVAIQERNNGASFLSGNAPLVEVLTAALVRNLKSKKRKGSSIEQIKDQIASETIVRNVYPHKEEIIRRLDYSNFENIKLKEGALKSSQHVVIYDEAQRAWSVEKMRKPGRSYKVWQKKTWSLSEPSLLLWDIDQLEWGVFICLVGGGQEINDGETGLNEWLRTLYHDKTLIEYNNWDIYLPCTLTGYEYQIRDKDEKTFNDYLLSIKREGQIKIIETDGLHLTQCQRTPLSSELSEFINKLVEGSAKCSDYDKFKERYTIALTRNIQTAKQYIRKRQEELQPLKMEIREEQESSDLYVEKKLIRGGMLMSSSALRLRAIGYPVKKVIDYLAKTPAWFLDTKEENIDSSDFLEVALNEFFVQGLEIDLGCVMWDGDFRFVPSKSSCTGSWEFHKFNKKKWTDPIKDDSHRNHLIRTYMRNSYRVLLTRSRLGLVIYVPLGDKNDPTRQPDIYDNTYNYLKNLGFLNLDN